MQFQFTPYECQGIATIIVRHFRKGRHVVRIEESIDEDAPLRTTLIAQKGELKIFVETMDKPSLPNALAELARWLFLRREYCELYVAAHSDSEMMTGLLTEYRKNGIGLLVVDENERVHIHEKARNPNLVIGEDPNLKLGHYKKSVMEVIEMHNRGDSRDAVREICEIVEGLTWRVLTKAAKKGWVTLTIEQIERMDWSNRIDVLVSPNHYVSGRNPILSQPKAVDLHSFRGARNMFDHPVRNNTARLDRERQVVERLFMGRRLVHDLGAMYRSIR